MQRSFTVLAVALCLAGCDNLSAVFTSATGRITAAFPLPEEVQAGSARLLAALDGDKAAKQLAGKQIDSLLEVRALTCTATARVGRFDTPAAIRKKVTDPDCFKKQDALVGDWVAGRRLGLVLREPPAYPMAPLPGQQTVLPAFAEMVIGVAVAAEANVMVVRGQQRFTAVQLPSGKQFSSFAVPEQGNRPATLSPNGRLLAVPMAQGLRIIEVGSGNAVWSTDKYTDVVGWLPRLDLVVLTHAVTGMPYVLDARRGTLQPYPAPDKGLTWSFLLEGDKLLVGGNGTVSVMQHSRTADGALDITPLKQWTVPRYLNDLHLMNKGTKLVFSRAGEVGWLNVVTGEQGGWKLGSTGTLAKVSDTAIYFESIAVGATSRVPQTLDVEKLTIASVTDAGPVGSMYSLGPRIGYLKRSSNAVVVAGSVQSENPQDLERMLSEAQLAVQLAKLVEAKPLLADVPVDAKLSVIGVYEPEGAVHSFRSVRKAVPIYVNIGPGTAPLVLALAANEPAIWTIKTNGRKIHTILLSGYNESSVVGQGNAQVLRIGSNYAYKIDSPEYVQLKKDIARYVSNPVQAFQGGYKGHEFTVQ